MIPAVCNIYEFFNQTHQTKPRFDSHDIFIKYVKYGGCESVLGLPYEDRCQYVRETPACFRFNRMINYMDIMFCNIGKAKSKVVDWIFIILLAACVFYLFQLMSQIVGKFFCPALNFIARTLRMSQSLAGATLLSVGNGAAILFMSWTKLDADTFGLYSGGFSIAIFQLSVVAGSVLVIQPFHIYRPLFIRDSLFILTLITYIHYILSDMEINIIESAVLLVFYICYLITVIIDVILIKKLSKDVRRKLKLLADENIGASTTELRRKIEELEEEGVMEILIKDSHSILDINTTRSTDFVDSKGPNYHIFQQFLESINPVDIAEWRKSGGVVRFLIVIRTPFLFLFLLACPRVDYNRINHGWSKLLNVLHLTLAPFYLITFSKLRTMEFHGVSLYLYVLAVMAPFMGLVFFTSRTDKSPIYHMFYAIMALCFAITLIRMCALELTSITYTMGIGSQVSPSFLFVTLHAWESGIGALIANTTLAFRGYPRMAFVACYGSPLFTLPLNFGVRLLYKSIKSPTGAAKVRQGPLAPTLYTFLFSSVFFSLIGVLLAKNKGRWSLGLFRIIIYPIFLLYVVLTEFEIVHSHGTDHTDQHVKMD